MIKTINEVVEGIQEQTSDEKVAYSITTTPWGSTPSSISVVAYDENTNTNVTTTVYPTNSPSAVGDVITLSLLRALTKGHSYRIEILFTDSTSNTWEAIFCVKCVK